MRKSCFAALLLAASSTCVSAQTRSESTSAPHKNVVLSDNGKLPLSFEANHGQTDERVKFLSRGTGYSLFLTKNEAVIALKKDGSSRVADKRHVGIPLAIPARNESAKGATLRMQLLGSNFTSRAVGADELPGKVNYFIGNDPSKWRTNVPTYAKVKYTDVYPGVDLVYYGNQGQLEYDFVLAPGADPNRIQLKFRGAGELRVNESGDLLLGAAGNEVRFQKPVVYQTFSRERKAVEGSYVMAAANTIRFRVADYDHSRPLVIDPVLAYSTYLGGSSDDVAHAIALDSDGNAYLTGATTSSDFPIVSPIQPTFHGGAQGDSFVTKINADGSALVYSTYLGGSLDDVGQGIALDADGNVYVTGWTASADFPTVNPIQPTLHNWRNAFVAKISAAGNVLVYSTYLGGGEDYGWGIAVDAAGRAHVGGDTRSRNFPVKNPIQGTLRSQVLFNSFVLEISADGGSLIYSTYLGGTGGEGGSRVALDSAGNTYIAGYTSSADFPVVNPIQAVFGGVRDAYLTKINAQGTALVYSTYIGGSDDDIGMGLVVDSAGNAYISGATKSTNFPTAKPFQSANRGGYDAFLAKVNAQGNALVCSSYLGGSTDEYGPGIASDSSGGAYVGGYTTSADFPVADAIQPIYGGNGDYFVTKIDTDDCAVVYSTYLGGSALEGSWAFFGVTADKTGNVYVTGFSQSIDFPTTPGAFQQSWSGGSDVIVAKIASVPATPVAPTVKLQPANQTVTKGSAVSFTAAASGRPVPTVQWQVSANGGATFSNVAGATATTLTFSAAFAENGNQYRAVFTNASGSATTNAATLTVNPPIPGDVNGDGVLNCADLAIVKASFGKKTGQAGFDSRADVNGDGIVNVLDLSFVARQLPAGTVCR